MCKHSVCVLIFCVCEHSIPSLYYLHITKKNPRREKENNLKGLLGNGSRSEVRPCIHLSVISCAMLTM